MYGELQDLNRTLSELNKSLSELTSRAPAELAPALYETAAHLLQARQSFDRAVSAVRPECEQWQPFELCDDAEGVPA